MRRLFALLAAACSHAAYVPAGAPGFEEICAAAEVRRRPDPGVRALLSDPEPRARARAALAAGRIADPATVPGLRGLLADAGAANVAAWALGRIQGGEAALIECLATSTTSPTSTSTSTSFRCVAPAEAARALGFGPRSDAVTAALARALVGPADVAAAAATALGVLARTGGKGA